MAFAAFDTHKYVKRLTAAGMPEPQAEVIADEQRSLIDDQLATKQDIKALEAATKPDIAATRHDIKALEAATKQDIAATRRDIKELEAATKRDIKELEATTKRDIKELEATTKREIAATRRDIKESEQRLIIRLGGMMIAGFGVIAALIKLLPSPAP